MDHYLSIWGYFPLKMLWIKLFVHKKISIVPQVIHRFNSVALKTLCMAFFIKQKNNLKIHTHMYVYINDRPGEFIFQCHILFSYCSWGSQGKKTKVVCHSLLQWTMCYLNSPTWPICLGWPYAAWLIVSLSQTWLWSMWTVWLVFCDCGFHSVCPLMDKDKRLMEVSWLLVLPGSCSDGWRQVQ